MADRGIVSKTLYLLINNNEGATEFGSMWKRRLLFDLIILSPMLLDTRSLYAHTYLVWDLSFP